ncbi:unnamed protein product [Choristocarpus tenellus]
MRFIWLVAAWNRLFPHVVRFNFALELFFIEGVEVLAPLRCPLHFTLLLSRYSRGLHSPTFCDLPCSEAGTQFCKSQLRQGLEYLKREIGFADTRKEQGEDFFLFLQQFPSIACDCSFPILSMG